MDYQWWSWLLGAVGVAGFFLAGKKVWWCWYVNIACQFLWFAYAIITEQWGFFAASLLYFAVFTKNAYEWTKEHRESKKLLHAQPLTDEEKAYLIKDLENTEALFSQTRSKSDKPWEPQGELYISSGRPVKVNEHPYASRREPSVYPRASVEAAMKEVKVADWSNTTMEVHPSHEIRYASGWGYCIWCTVGTQNGNYEEKFREVCPGPKDK